MNMDLLGSLPLVVIWLALGAVGIAIQAFVRNNTRLVFGYYIFTLALTGILAMLHAGHKSTAFSGMVNVGGFANYFDVLFCGAGIMSMLAARPYLQREDNELDEYYTLLVSAVAGMMLIAHSANLIALFVGIELMSISFYVMTGFLRSNIRSIEGALKYFLLGAFASGFLVYGMSLVYGATGSLYYDQIAAAIAPPGHVNFPVLLAIGSVLMAVALGFKVAAFPFHQWAPDVYEGAPSVVTAFMSTAGKAAAFAAFVTVFSALMPAGSALTPQLQQIIAVMSAATMLVGNITALAQTNVKRMLAYSSVAHAGYLLMGIVANSQDGHNAIYFYVTSYVFMQLGAFVVVGLLERGNEGHLQINDYAGLAKREPVLAFIMSVFMFSLAGIPPMAGFFGKYLLFVSVVETHLWLTLVAVLSSLVSAYFYLGLIVKMYFSEPEGNHQPVRSGIAGITLAITTAASIVLGLFTTQLLSIFGSW